MEVNYCPAETQHELIHRRCNDDLAVGPSSPAMKELQTQDIDKQVNELSSSVVSNNCNENMQNSPINKTNTRKGKVTQDSQDVIFRPHLNAFNNKNQINQYATFDNRGFFRDDVQQQQYKRQQSCSSLDNSAEELDGYKISKANDSSQNNHVANKSGEKDHHQPNETYSNSTLIDKTRLPTCWQRQTSVIFENICYNIPRYQNIINDCLTTMYCTKKPPVIPILKSINLNIPQGSIYGLLGPSSCGKTTLLRCLVGLLKPTRGTIRLFGCDLINENNTEEDYRRSKHCHVPGKNVGYMPQDLGLYEDFSIKQILTMFGRYMFMEETLIRERIDFMTEFLDLPSKHRIVNTLSGGQKRRVSFAIACFHMPPLIILDEPTVGVDPLLRKAIWTFLRRLASNENKTILITTHYIEEAAKADLVALMRNGEIVMEDTPKNIMQSQSSSTLEEAFLKICNNVDHSKPTAELLSKNSSSEDISKQPVVASEKFSVSYRKPGNNSQLYSADLLLEEYGTKSCFEILTRKRSYSFQTTKLEDYDNSCNNIKKISSVRLKNKQLPSGLNNEHNCNAGHNKESSTVRDNTTGTDYPSQSIRSNILASDSSNSTVSERTSSCLLSVKKNIILFQALLYKNYKRNFNSIPLVIFQFMLPIVQMITFCLCIGGKPNNIGVGVVNMDSPSIYYTTLDTGEKVDPLANVFLTYIDTSMMDLKPYPNLTHAIEDVSRAKLWAVLEFGPNFTEAVTQRFSLPDLLETEAKTVNESLIRLHSDKTRRILDILCLRSLMESYKQFLNHEFIGFERLPVEMGRPIFKIKPSLIGSSVDGYTESIAAGLMASLTYFMAAGLTTFIMVVERGDGILERTYTTGISPFTYLFAHAVFRSLVMMAQIAFLMALTFLILDQPLLGSPVLLYMLLIMLNCTGISFGLLISSLCKDQNGAALTIVSSLVVKLTLSGILWPLEAIPNLLKFVSAIQPLTMPVKALRSITLKGRDLSDRNVILGFVICIMWFVIFLTIASKRFKFYK